MWDNTRPITEGEIGPVEDATKRAWCEDGNTTVIRQIKLKDGTTKTERTKLPEPAKLLSIYFGRIIAVGETATYGERMKC